MTQSLKRESEGVLVCYLRADVVRPQPGPGPAPPPLQPVGTIQLQQRQLQHSKGPHAGQVRVPQESHVLLGYQLEHRRTELFLCALFSLKFKKNTM